MIFILLARRLRLGELIWDFSKDLQLLSSEVGLVPNTEAQVLSTSTTLTSLLELLPIHPETELAQGPINQGISGGHLANVFAADIFGVTTGWRCYWHLEANMLLNDQCSGQRLQ